MNDPIDRSLLRDPYEVCEAVRKAMEPRTRQFLGMKIVILSNADVLPPGVVARAWCGPKPEQNVWIIG